ncbi:MAG: type II toxin-antitoxin system VapC family toxin [Desulfatiglandales bacterium]
MKLVLDTNVYCDFAEGIPETVETIALHGEQIFMPAIVIGELVFGFLKGGKQQLNERKLRQVLNRLKIETIDVTADVARKYAIIFLSLQKAGTRIPINDVWIAACCMEVGGTLLTRDKHFKSVRQVDSIII